MKKLERYHKFVTLKHVGNTIHLWHQMGRQFTSFRTQSTMFMK